MGFSRSASLSLARCYVSLSLSTTLSTGPSKINYGVERTHGASRCVLFRNQQLQVRVDEGEHCMYVTLSLSLSSLSIIHLCLYFLLFTLATFLFVCSLLFSTSCCSPVQCTSLLLRERKFATLSSHKEAISNDATLTLVDLLL